MTEIRVAASSSHPSNTRNHVVTEHVRASLAGSHARPTMLHSRATNIEINQARLNVTTNLIRLNIAAGQARARQNGSDGFNKVKRSFTNYRVKQQTQAPTKPYTQPMSRRPNKIGRDMLANRSPQVYAVKLSQRDTKTKSAKSLAEVDGAVRSRSSDFKVHIQTLTEPQAKERLADAYRTANQRAMETGANRKTADGKTVGSTAEQIPGTTGATTRAAAESLKAQARALMRRCTELREGAVRAHSERLAIVSRHNEQVRL